jgi:hypothetical protein
MRCNRRALFDHLVSAGDQRRRNVNPEALCGPKINDQLELGRQLNGKFVSSRPSKYAINVGGGTPQRIG